MADVYIGCERLAQWAGPHSALENPSYFLLNGIEESSTEAEMGDKGFFDGIGDGVLKRGDYKWDMFRPISDISVVRPRQSEAETVKFSEDLSIIQRVEDWDYDYIPWHM